MEKKKKNHTVPLIRLRYSAPASALREVGVGLCNTSDSSREISAPTRGVPSVGGHLCSILAGLEAPGSPGGCFGGNGGRAEPCSALTSAPVLWVSPQGARGAGALRESGAGFGLLVPSFKLLGSNML